MAAEIRFVLESLDVVAVGPGKQPPIQVMQIVPRRVLAVLAELDGEPVVGAAMQAAEQPFHDHLCRAAAGP